MVEFNAKWMWILFVNAFVNQINWKANNKVNIYILKLSIGISLFSFQFNVSDVCVYKLVFDLLMLVYVYICSIV